MKKPETLYIDGGRFKALLASQDETQIAVANAAGVTKFATIRWCKPGRQGIRKPAAEAVACRLGMKLDEFLAQVGWKEESEMPVFERVHVAAEADLLKAWRRLAPLDQAKIRVAIDDALNRASSSPPSRRG
jgi:hypothetical protein